VVILTKEENLLRNKLLIMGIILILVLSLAGCKGENKQITDLSMLKGGKTFAVPTGTTADKFVLKKFPDAKSSRSTIGSPRKSKMAAACKPPV
jgi:hypothetical protein